MSATKVAPPKFAIARYSPSLAEGVGGGSLRASTTCERGNRQSRQSPNCHVERSETSLWIPMFEILHSLMRVQNDKHGQQNGQLDVIARACPKQSTILGYPTCSIATSLTLLAMTDTQIF